MTIRSGGSMDFTGFAILAAMLDPVSTDPSGLSSGQEGRVWYNTTNHKLMYWNGTTAIDMLARANHTGTQAASTISDLAATVQAYTLNQFAAPVSDITMASHKITNLLDPTSAQDAATRNYVDSSLNSLASGQVLKGAVKVASATNIAAPTTAPGATIDGVTMTAGDIFLLTGQTTASQNGPYTWTNATSAARATNFATSAQAVLGSYWIVEQGSNADTFALLTNDTAITLGTTALTFVIRGTAGTTYSVNGGLTLSGSSIAVNAGTGILAPAGASTTTSIDTSVVVRKVGGAIPATSTGIFSVSGANVTINHGLNNSAPNVVLVAGSTPAAGFAANKPVLPDYSVTDANNIVLALPAAPATNNWSVQVTG